MRVIVFFDLPTITSINRREYRRFRKFLIKGGFVMNQESVYSKLALNTSVARSIIDNVKKNAPDEGIVELLTITEKQFSKIQFIVGESQNEMLDSDERLIIL